MNKARRKKIEEARGLLMKASEIITECIEEEDEAYNNLPDSIRYSETGDQYEECLDTLSNTIENLDSLSEDLQYIIEG